MSVYEQKERGVNAWIERFFRNKADAAVTSLIVGLILGALIVNPGAKYLFSFFGG